MDRYGSYRRLIIHRTREGNRVRIKGLDHIVLTVKDIETTCDFYHQVLGFEILTFGDNRKALQFGDQKINLHRSGEEIEPYAGQPTPGSADLCFITLTPVADIVDFLNQNRVAIELGPVKRSGARGGMISIYIRDPDNNLLELSNYL